MTAERNEADDMSSRESLGRARAAAQSIYDDPDAPVAYEPQGAAECREAVTALSERFAAAVRRRACSSRQQAHVPAEDRVSPSCRPRCSGILRHVLTIGSQQ